MLIIFKELKDGKVEFTQEELQKILEEAKKEGYDAGYKDGLAENIHIPPNPTYIRNISPKDLVNRIHYEWDTNRTDSNIQKAGDNVTLTVQGNVAESTLNPETIQGNCLTMHTNFEEE